MDWGFGESLVWTEDTKIVVEAGWAWSVVAGNCLKCR
jgi:hypothetical protein